MSTILAAALFVGLIVLTLAGVEKQRGQHAAAPKCPCGCGRHPSEHTEQVLFRMTIPRQRGPQ